MIDSQAPFVEAFAPGRTELAGNHTDHQGGCVIAATLDCGITVRMQENGTDRVHIESEGFAPFGFSVADISPCDSDRGTTSSLVCGIMAGLAREGLPLTGFDAQIASTIPSGGGLSSSAALELAFAAALDTLFGEGEGEAESEGGGAISDARKVLIAQAAERDWFGKPCGLMDQLSIQLGGIQVMDFSRMFGAAQDGVGSDTNEGSGMGADSGTDADFGTGAVPSASSEMLWEAEPISFDFEASGYAICLIDTHCDHSRFTDEYAQVAIDMARVARHFGVRALSELPEQDFLAGFDRVRSELGDLAALRGLHFYNEMKLVRRRVHALRTGDIQAFIQATRQSGASSAHYLQNVSALGHPEQPAMVALGLADLFLQESGACRIHGGGFGGTIQAFVPHDALELFTAFMDQHLGAGSCRHYSISTEGAHAKWIR